MHTISKLQTIRFRKILCVIFGALGQDVVFGTVKGELGLWNPDKFGSCLKNILHAGAEVDQILVQVTSGMSCL